MSRPKVILPLAVVALGALTAVALIRSASQVDKLPPEQVAPLVRVIPVEVSTHQLRVSTHGTIAPRTESDLIPEVSGTVIWVSSSLVSGGFFEKGDPLLRIDPSDYEVALKRATANLARASSEHRRASKELKRRRGLADRNVGSAAQLDDAENAEHVTSAALHSARAELDKAEHDLERTELTAPWAGRVRQERVDVGQFVNRGVSVASLYAVDYVEVRLPISDRELEFLELPMLYRGDTPEEMGPEVRLAARFGGADYTWRGRVVRTEGEIDPKSRMVNVVARVEDPYAESDDGRPPLAVGLFVFAEIEGRRVENAVVLPRAAMRGADRVLVVDADDRLRFRAVDVLRAAREEVVIQAGLEAGELVSVSQLEAVMDGMKVRPLLEGTGAAREVEL